MAALSLQLATQQGAAPDRLQLRSFLTALSAAGELGRCAAALTWLHGVEVLCSPICGYVGCEYSRRRFCGSELLALAWRFGLLVARRFGSSAGFGLRWLICSARLKVLCRRGRRRLRRHNSSTTRRCTRPPTACARSSLRLPAAGELSRCVARLPCCTKRFRLGLRLWRRLWRLAAASFRLVPKSSRRLWLSACGSCPTPHNKALHPTARSLGFCHVSALFSRCCGWAGGG